MVICVISFHIVWPRLYDSYEEHDALILLVIRLQVKTWPSFSQYFRSNLTSHNNHFIRLQSSFKLAIIQEMKWLIYYNARSSKSQTFDNPINIKEYIPININRAISILVHFRIGYLNHGFGVYDHRIHKNRTHPLIAHSSRMCQTDVAKPTLTTRVLLSNPRCALVICDLFGIQNTLFGDTTRRTTNVLSMATHTKQWGM